jgi:hypothetical protein
MPAPTFVDLYLAGLVAEDAVHDYIEEWHEQAEPSGELHEWLGLTWPEYAVWVEEDELPTKEGREAELWPVRLQGGRVVRAHGVALCERPCAIHWPSQHHMRTWPQHWRGDRGIIERVCDHGVGHPDPDDRDRNKVHGCDGCCLGMGPELFDDAG